MQDIYPLHLHLQYENIIASDLPLMIFAIATLDPARTFKFSDLISAVIINDAPPLFIASRSLKSTFSLDSKKAGIDRAKN